MAVRYQDPAKVLAAARLRGPGRWSDELFAQLLDMPVERLRELREQLAARVRAAAATLIERLDLRSSPLPAGSFAVGLGDSITHDALSWFEILRAVSEVLGGESRFDNRALSGDTTADLIRRLPPCTSERCTHVLVMIGTNDCTRLGPGGERLIAAAETARNLRIVASHLAVGAEAIWMTPPPVDEAAAGADEGFRERLISWRDADLRELAATMRSSPLAVIDTQNAFEVAHPHLWEDGLHPTLEGQIEIAAAVLGALRARKGG